MLILGEPATFEVHIFKVHMYTYYECHFAINICSLFTIDQEGPRYQLIGPNWLFAIILGFLMVSLDEDIFNEYDHYISFIVFLIFFCFEQRAHVPCDGAQLEEQTWIVLISLSYWPTIKLLYTLVAVMLYLHNCLPKITLLTVYQSIMW